jgi:broad specificity phosphatase PhoE
MTHFVFVRHGQTDWNRENRFRGRVDVPLNAVGLEQAKRAAMRLAPAPIAAVYASPVSRTMVTAELIAQPHGLGVMPRAELYDLDYGDWQGKMPEEVEPAEYARWLRAPAEVKFPGGESVGDLRKRIVTLVAQLSAQHEDETVVLVSHDVVGKVLVCALLGADDNAIHRVQQDTACINRFQVENGVYLLRTVNETAHLE